MFSEALRDAGADMDSGEARAKALFRELAEAHSGEGRRYHDLRHVEEVLGHVDAFADALADPAAARLAAFFHDAVYDTTADDNEERSAEYAERRLARLGLPRGVIERVRGLVLATKAAGETLADDAPFDARLFVDADTAILGASPGRYDEYARDVRREFARFDEAAWRAGRLRFLRGIAGRPRVFLTDGMGAALEERARANVAREIGLLSPGAP